MLAVIQTEVRAMCIGRAVIQTVYLEVGSLVKATTNLDEACQEACVFFFHSLFEAAPQKPEATYHCPLEAPPPEAEACTK